MAWARFDDQFPDHPKIAQAGPLAAWLHTCAICYCSRYLTDGFVPAGQVRKLADVDNAMDLAERLVDCGLWERCDNGFMVHDYLDYNPPREKVLAEREAAKRRMQGKRSGGVRPNIERTEMEPDAKFNGPVPVPVVSTPTGRDAPAADAAPVPIRPKKPRDPTDNECWHVWEECMEFAGQSPSAHPGKRRQLGKLKQLLRQYPAGDLVGCFRWLWTTDFERNRGVDMFRVAQRIDSYITAGKPDPGRPDATDDMTDDDRELYSRGYVVHG